MGNPKHTNKKHFHFSKYCDKKESMSQSLKSQLSLSQNLKITTWLQQSIKILALSRLELKETVEQELLSNPFLENPEENSIQEKPNPSEDKENTKTGVSDLYTSIQMGEFNRDSYRAQRKDYSTPYIPEQFIPETQTLKNHLEWQARVSPLSNKDKCIILLLISHLDEKGYLTVPLEELAEKESLSINGLEKALFILQTFDPPGIGARDIKECLSIQARAIKKHKEDLTFIINNHLNNLEKQNLKPIAKDLKKTLSEIKALCEIIKLFTPQPAKNFSSGPVSYIVPDIYIYKENGKYKALLHQESFPMLKISSHYKDSLQASEKHKKVLKKYFKEKMHSGQYFIRSLKQRKDIIVKVIDSIIKYQTDFFEKGTVGLKSIILKDVANDIGVHISTVSRAVSNKYVHTPRGVFPLKYFFTASKLSSDGQTVPVAPIKAQIKNWISEENPARPLTDAAITNKINSHFQINISRRVVSKYREALGLPPSMKRKR